MKQSDMTVNVGGWLLDVEADDESSQIEIYTFSFQYQSNLFIDLVSEMTMYNPVWQFDARMPSRKEEAELKRGPMLEYRTVKRQRLYVPSKGTILQWDLVLDGMYDWLENVQALRAVCRDTVSEFMLVYLCDAAFHEKPMVLDPFSDPTKPLWLRCFHNTGSDMDAEYRSDDCVKLTYADEPSTGV